MPARYPQQELFIANTDRAWFDYLAACGTDGVVDEVNFWSPRATRPMKRMHPGEPIFFRLKRPDYAIAGYGFFADFSKLSLRDAWELFGWKNGDPASDRFFARIAVYRGVRPTELDLDRDDIGCNILREARFLPENRWISWTAEQGWRPNIVQGRTEADPTRVKVLHTLLQEPRRSLAEFADRFEPVTQDNRLLVAREAVLREGQGAFRLRMLRAYDRQCAITGEHTEPVLDAAHIQPYLGPASNHVQNGLVLTKEFHALFDRGYVSITPDYKVRVSPRLHEDWKNGRRYLPYDGERLVRLPNDEAQQPSRGALEWHYENVFKRAG